jgi:hypothetical protein
MRDKKYTRTNLHNRINCSNSPVICPASRKRFQPTCINAGRRGGVRPDSPTNAPPRGHQRQPASSSLVLFLYTAMATPSASPELTVLPVFLIFSRTVS